MLLEDLLGNKWFQVLIVLLIALVLRAMVHRYIAKIVERAVKVHHYKSRKIEEQREQTLTSILRTAGAVVVWITVVIVMLSILEVDIAALLTGAGLIGIVVGFGAQGTIKDFIAGVFVIVENQYRVGDVVTLAGKSGVVEDITIRVTRLRDLDGNLHIIPNGQADTVTNMTFDYANVNINIGVSYDADLDKVKQVIDQLGKDMARDPKWKESINEPISFLRIDNFSDSGVTIKALGQVAPGQQWDVAGEFRQRLKAEFDKRGIEIPFPQRVIHTIKE